MERQKLTRAELYELVWTVPMVKLAPRFGMSDVALRKRCQKHDIPTPGAGYWPQVAMGQSPARVALPSTDADDQIIFHIHQTVEGVPKPPVPTVVLAERLENLHPAAAWLDGSLKKAESDQHGRLLVGETWHPVAVLSPGCRERALQLVDALFKALEARTHKVEARSRGEHSPGKALLVTAFDQAVSVEIEEKLERRPHALTKEEVSEKERWEKSGWGTWDRAPKYDYYPDSELKLSIGLTHHGYTGRKSWADTKTQRLEDLLGQAIVAIEVATQLGHREKAEAARREAEARDAERQRLRGERLELYQRRLADELQQQASAWSKATEVRSFLSAYDEALPSGKRSPAAEAWFKAAQAFANRLDPLTSPEEVARDLDPADEVLERLAAREKRAAQEAVQQQARSNYGHAPSPAPYPFWLRHGR